MKTDWECENYINDTKFNMLVRLNLHDCICVGVSGGSDSTIIVDMICTYFRQYLPKIHFVFENTGIEYRATLRHLDYMEERYGIHIDRIRPKKGNEVVSVVRRYGVPVLSKEFSKDVYYAEKGKDWAILRITRDKKQSPYAYPEKTRALAEYLVKNNIPVSNKCCDLSKKQPHLKYIRGIGADLTISGERKCEGGLRATAHKSCYGKWHNIDKYMPLWWDDDVKAFYKKAHHVQYSDCYEVWGMVRTGCVGCPYNSRVGEDLQRIKQYEPTTYKVCMNVFGESYKLMTKFGYPRLP